MDLKFFSLDLDEQDMPERTVSEIPPLEWGGWIKLRALGVFAGLPGFFPRAAEGARRASVAGLNIEPAADMAVSARAAAPAPASFSVVGPPVGLDDPASQFVDHQLAACWVGRCSICSSGFNMNTVAVPEPVADLSEGVMFDSARRGVSARQSFKDEFARTRTRVVAPASPRSAAASSSRIGAQPPPAASASSPMIN